MRLPPQLPSDPLRRIWLIENSVIAFACAWASLIPFIGLLLAPITLVLCRRVQVGRRGSVNPASGRVYAAVRIASFAMILQIFLLEFGAQLFRKSLM